MCLLALAWKQHPRLRLLAAANRDEFHERPTRAAQFWPDQPELLAGQDKKAGGSWLGLSRQGRFAAVTNVREPGAETGHLSRGHLVRDFLLGRQPAMDFLQQLRPQASQYAGFNLLLCDGQSLAYFSNRNGSVPRLLEPGIYALSNHQLDTPWPKLLRLKQQFAQQLEQGQLDDATLFQLLRDEQAANPEDLPDTGLAKDWEHRLSAPFVITPDYGTRCSTLLSLWEDGSLRFRERRFDPAGQVQGDSLYRMSWENPH